MKYFVLAFCFLGSLLVSSQSFAQTMQCSEFFHTSRFVKLSIFTTPPNSHDPDHTQRKLDGRLYYRNDAGEQNLKVDRTNIDQYVNVNFGAYSQQNMNVRDFNSVDELFGYDIFWVDFRNMTMTSGNPLCHCEFKKDSEVPKCGFGT